MDEKISIETSIDAKPLLKLAKLSVILGLLSGIFGFFTAIPPIICAHLFLYKMKRSSIEIDATYHRMAIGGLIFGYTGLLVWIFIVILLMDITIA